MQARGRNEAKKAQLTPRIAQNPQKHPNHVPGVPAFLLGADYTAEACAAFG